MNGGSASPNVFAEAIHWLDAALLGSLASAIAVIAVASIGFGMLSGRIEVRRAIQIIIGCFIIFGASTIAGGIMGVTNGGESAPQVNPPPTQLSNVPQTVRSVANSPYDPYAGAALPPRR